MVFHWTICASPSAVHSFPISSRVLDINDLVWMLPAVLSVSHRTTYIRLEVSLPESRKCEQRWVSLFRHTDLEPNMKSSHSAQRLKAQSLFTQNYERNRVLQLRSSSLGLGSPTGSRKQLLQKNQERQRHTDSLQSLPGLRDCLTPTVGDLTTPHGRLHIPTPPLGQTIDRSYVWEAHA